MKKDFHTTNAIKETVNQLDRIQFVSDPHFKKFLKLDDKEKFDIIWTLVNLTIKAGIFAMSKGISFTIPNICRFHQTSYSQFIQETRRKFFDRPNKEGKQAIKDKLLGVTTFRNYNRWKGF
jgi:hypothetical protein